MVVIRPIANRMGLTHENKYIKACLEVMADTIQENVTALMNWSWGSFSIKNR